jgi:GAF domain-containing protein
MKSMDEIVASQAALALEAEERYTELRDVLCKELRKALELRTLALQFEVRLYDQIEQYNKELQKILSS